MATFDTRQQNEEEQLPGQVEYNFSDVNLKLKSQHTEGNMHLTKRLKDNLSEVSNRSALPINDEQTVVFSNNSSLEAKETEQEKSYKKCLIFIFFGYTLGIRMRYNWRPLRYFMLYCCIFALWLVAFSISYTAYNLYLRGEYVRLIEPFSISGVLVSCTSKFIGFIKHRHRILSLFLSMNNYIQLITVGRPAEIVLENIRKAFRFLLLFSLGVGFSVSFFAVIPIVLYLTRHEVTPLLPVEIIYCDRTTISGFIIEFIISMILGTYSAVATIFHVSVVIICIATYILQGDLIEHDFQELNGMWIGKNNIPLAYKHAFLKNICLKRQDMNNFLNILRNIYEPQFLYYFCYSYFAQIVALYDIKKHDWVGGYGPVCGIFFEMMFYCYLGTQVSIVNDKLCYVIYDSHWHTYDLKSQRTIQLMLHEAQQNKDLNMGVIGPLNLVTGVVIIKSIYSYYTVMTELF